MGFPIRHTLSIALSRRVLEPTGESARDDRRGRRVYQEPMKRARTCARIGLLMGLAGCGGQRASDRPNLLLVTLDTVRTDRLGAYGHDAARTPVLDGLAARGVTFDEAYTPAPMTLPAHATLLTGVLPPEHGARVNGVHRLADRVPTLGEWLGEAGYRTGAFVAAFVLDEKFGLARGFDRYDDDLTGAYDQDTPEELSTYRPGNLVVDSALEWLEEGDGTEPFFAWVHLYDAHFPWHPHGADGVDPNAETGTYDGEIAFLDVQVGRLLAFLDERGLREKTVVMAVADHGEGLGDHHEVEHAYLLDEEVLHVPWLVAGPGVKPGHRVSALVSLEDLQPTALDLLGVKGGGARGRSLVSALRGEPIAAGTSYAETELPWTSFRWAPQYSLTTERWKYVRTPQTELYDRATDRREYANLAEAKPDVVEELDARLTELEATLVVCESELAPVTSEEMEQLAALGYAAGTASDILEECEGLADVKARLAVKELAAKLRRGLAKELIGVDERIEMAQRLVAESPETPSFHAQLGDAYVQAGDYARALPELELTVELAPTDAGAHYSLGDALQQIGRNAEARLHMEVALEMDPSMAAAHVGMGNVLRSEKRPDVAAGEYTEALRLRPRYAEAYFNLAQTFVDRDMPERAIENLELALECRPGWALAHAGLANLVMGSGRPEDALPHFEAALEEFPGDVDLHNDLGVALNQLGRPNQARDHYVLAMQLQPDFYRPYINLANLAFDLGNDAGALEQYQEALRRAPGLAEPTARLARFLATTPAPAFRDGARAVALAERAADLTQGKVARVLDTLAAAYASAGRFPDAVSAAHRAQKRASLDGDAELAAEVEGRLALYALEQAYFVPRASTQEQQAEPTEAGASEEAPFLASAGNSADGG